MTAILAVDKIEKGSTDKSVIFDYIKSVPGRKSDRFF
jgi:hypothetical protein